MTSLSPALRALLARSIDYAGMFPPCSLSLEQALENQAGYVRDADAWMLNAFVLPVEKFEAAAALMERFDHDHPLRVSALGPKTASREDFLTALRNAREQVESFQQRHAGRVIVDQIEMVAPDDADFAEAGAIIGELRASVFFEAPAATAEAVVGRIAASGAERIGYKLRTGGVTADAFPTSAQIGKALVAAARHSVAIKFTAGLHHPVRQHREEVNTKMHGFLNVLGAAVLAFENKWDEQQTAAMLEDENTKSFGFDGDTFSWREHEIGAARIAAHRERVKSFGSCSFNEPREDLRALNLL